MKNINIKDFELNEKSLEQLKEGYSTNCAKRNNIVRSVLNKNPISSVVYKNENEPNTVFTFSKEIKTLPVCNQKRSGRCWIFAGLNVLREIIASKLGLKDFELSQNYIALFDKLEKCNYLMSSIVDLISEKPDSRVLMHLLTNGIGDGGQRDMFRNLVVKYGIVPKANFNETYQSSNTMETTFLINTYIRQFAAEIKKSDANPQIIKKEYLAKIYNLLISSFGVPPTKFDFEYKDSKDVYHCEKDLTPKSFFDKYIGNEIDEYVSIINSPTKDKPFYKTYTIDYLNNVIEGKLITHLNLPMDRIKELIKKQIDDDKIVWFGSDVAFYRNRETGIWDDQAYDYLDFFDFEPIFNKEEMLDYHASVMNHAMCLTGYNEKDGIINRYKIENSWGGDCGDKGYFIMSNTWFDQFVYQAVILKKYLNSQELSALKEEVTHLDPWDPMGTLAD